MDQRTLVSEEIDAGRQLVEGFGKIHPVTDAFWLAPSEEGKWYLYIVAEGVTGENIGLGYGDIIRVQRDMQTPYLNSFRVKLIAPDHPLARDVQKLRDHYAGLAPLPVRYGETILGGQSIDETYFYPSVSATTNP